MRKEIVMASVPTEKLERDVTKEVQLALKCCEFLRQTNPTALSTLADVNDELVITSTMELGIQFLIVAAQKPNGTRKGLLFAINEGSIAYICQTVS
jgi:hypothetical protein